MGSASRKLKRKNSRNNYQSEPSEQKQKLTFAEWDRLYQQRQQQLENEFKNKIRENTYETIYDCFTVMADMLVNDFGKLLKKDTRLQVFGELVKRKLPEQLREHGLEKNQLLVDAGLTRNLE